MADDRTVLVRFEGPRQGLQLLVHALRQADLVVVDTGQASEQPAPSVVVTCVLIRVAAAGRGAAELVDTVRSVLEAFASRYHRAGLDIVDPLTEEDGPHATA